MGPLTFSKARSPEPWTEEKIRACAGIADDMPLSSIHRFPGDVRVIMGPRVRVRGLERMALRTLNLASIG